MRMDLGEWIIPIIFIGSIIFQILSSLFKLKKGGDNKPSPPISETQDNRGSEWDELMEALGQEPEKKYEIETVEPVSNKTEDPPPIPEEKQYVAPPPRKSVFDLQEEAQHKLEEANREAERILKGRQLGSFKQTSTYGVKKQQHYETSDLIKTLKNRSAIREAIIINELLQPPIALR
ncbi:MAG: hypothetical protein AAF984_02870 [Verrucomicrobiota bacterium]